MPTYRVKLTQPFGIATHVISNANASQLASLWQTLGFFEVFIVLTTDEEGHTAEEVKLVPWHMVAYIDPVPYPVTPPKGDVLYGKEPD